MTGNHGHYMHIPGYLSRRGVLDVGKKCVHSCSFCFYADTGNIGHEFDAVRREAWRPTEQLVRQVELMADNGFIGFDITGGEPTLHPGILDIVTASRDAGLASRIITLGQHLDRNNLLVDLVNHGVSDFRMSYHSCFPNTFHTMTGADLEKLENAMDYLDSVGFQYTSNTVITGLNYKELPDISRSLAKKNIYNAVFQHVMSHYSHAETADSSGLRARYMDVGPYLRQAVDILESEGISVTIRYAPMCGVAGVERNLVGQVGVRYDPHEWMNAVEYTGPGCAERESEFLLEQQGQPASGAQLLAMVAGGVPVGRGVPTGLSKVFPEKCQICSAIRVCDGVDPGYLSAHGDAEFIPYCNVDVGDVLHRDRINYLAGHVVKLLPLGDPREAVRRLLKPEPLGDSPLVSVVVANHNHAGLIGRCINSLLAQTYRDIEVIVVDDGSTDGSRDAIDKMGLEWADIRGYQAIFRTTASGGAAVPRNMGIKSSSGSLVMVIDPDDWVEPTYIEECVRALRRNPWASIAYAGIDTFGMEEKHWITSPYDMGQEIHGNFIPVMSLYRREIWEDAGGYEESAAIRSVEDYDLWVSAVRLGYLGVPVPRQLIHYYRNPDGQHELITKPNLERMTNEIRARNQEVYPIETAMEAKHAASGSATKGIV